MAAPRIEGFKLSAQQRRLWQLAGDQRLCAQCAIAITGDLDVERLKRAVARVVERYEILRTSFRRRPGMKFPLQVVHDDCAAAWCKLAPDAVEGESFEFGIQALLRGERSHGFDLEHGPLLRFALVATSPDRWLLLATLPALCADGRSLVLLTDELAHWYGAGSSIQGNGRDPLQYADFAQWQEELLEGDDEEAVHARRLWSRVDFGALATLALPQERSVPGADGGFALESFSFTLCAPELLARIDRVAQERGTSISTFLLAGWMAALWRLGAGDDLAVGVLADGRRHVDLEDCIGPIARYLPVIGSLDGRRRFTGLLDDLERSRGTVEELQEYGVWTSETFPFTFEAADRPPDCHAAGVVFSLVQRLACVEPFKLGLVAQAQDGRVDAELRYDAQRYPAREVERLAERVCVLLAAAASEPLREIGGLDLLPAHERRRLLIDFDGAVADPLPTGCFHELFARRARRDPTNVALRFEGEALTTGDLEARANRLAHHLRELGVGPESRVAIFAGRSPEAIVALLGVLKAGGAYVPLDPVYPRERLASILETAGVSVVLTQEELLGSLPEHPAHRLCLDRDREAIARQSDQEPVCSAEPENLAYILFTSGSTGRPKGVAVEHRQILHYLRGIRARLELPSGSSYATVSTLAADLGNTAIFPGLYDGTLHLIAQERVSDPAALGEAFRAHPVDCLKIVPSHLAALMASGEPESILPRRCLVIGGEAVKWELAERIFAANPELKVLNHYGPTETTVGTTTCSIEPGQRLPDATRLCLGRPLAGTRVYLLNRELQPVPPGVTAELYIGGGGLARGYWAAADQTARAFIPDPWSGLPGERLYKTGDLARFLPEGDLEFLGRADEQVKIRGFRIELGEIEALLGQVPEVWEGVATVEEGCGSDPQLVAFVVPRQGAKPDAESLRNHLKERLPYYMVPARFVFLDALPLTPNGKRDRRALAVLAGGERSRDARGVAGPKNLIELRLLQIWEDLLDISPISVDEGFFDIGGHSLLAVRLMAQIDKRLGCSLPLATLYRCPTIEQLARAVVSDAELGPPSPLVPIQSHGTRLPFFCVHAMGGEVLCYYHLSRALGKDQPFYGIQAHGLVGGEDGCISIEEMAAQYAAAVRRVLPEGPYLLGGYSFGSKVAFEMAHQIRRQGGKVALLALLDGGAPGKAAKLDRLDEAVFVTQALKERARENGTEFAISFQMVQRQEPAVRLEYVLAEAKAQGVLPPEVDVAFVRKLLHGIQARQRAGERYRPEVYSDPIVYFRSVEQDVEFDDVLREAGYEVDEPTKGWHRFASQPIEIHDIPGLHEMLMMPPGVEVLARQLTEVLDRVHEALRAEEAAGSPAFNAR